MSRVSVAVMVLSVAGLSAQVGGRARAQECQATSDCAKGFSCEVTSYEICSGSAPAFRPSCDGGACDAAPPPPTEPTCTTQESGSCVPAKCMNDTDCASGYVCHGTTVSDCVTTAYPCTNGVCPTPPSCSKPWVSYQCVPRSTLPCQQASDCGAGFTCEAQEVCECSGSAGTATPSSPAPGQEPSVDAGTPSADLRAPSQPLPPADGGGVPAPPECKCYVSEEQYCKLVPIACKADSDCPAGLGCEISGNIATAVPACDPKPGVDGGCGAALPAPPPVTTGMCVPPYKRSTGPGAAVPVSATNPAVPPTGSIGGRPTAATEADAADSHVRACAAVDPGTHRTGAWALWASLMMLAAAFVARRRDS